MDWIESLQKVIPWVSNLPIVPKLLISAVAVALNAVFLILVWTPTVRYIPETDAEVLAAYARMQRVLSRLASRSDGTVTVDGKVVPNELNRYYAPYLAVNAYVREHPGNVTGAYEEIWNHGGSGRAFIDDTQAFESVVAGFFRAYEEAKNEHKKAAG